MLQMSLVHTQGNKYPLRWCWPSQRWDDWKCS